MADFEGLSSYLKHLERDLGWEIVIDDFYGHLRVDPRFRRVMGEAGIHRNRFCMKIKENRKLWDRCLAGKTGLLRACEERGSLFRGCCFCGREEYILPLMVEGRAVGALSIGGFSGGPHPGDRREKGHRNPEGKLAHTAEKFSLDGKELERIRKEAAPLPFPGPGELEERLRVVSEYITLYYTTLNLPRSRPVPQGVKSDRQYILAHAVEYIKRRYNEPLAATDVARFCGVSESYINHNFKRYLGESFRSYLNRIRTAEAARRLRGGEEKITAIALDCGYEDPNYFSRIFSRLYGCSPREFRKEKRCPPPSGSSLPGDPQYPE